jgi:hypothetical protein
MDPTGSTRSSGGYIFAEHPDREAPEARILWHADYDPGTLSVVATPIDVSDPEAICMARLAPWLDIVSGDDGRQHAVVTDGWHRIRLDVEQGSLTEHSAVLLEFRLKGLTTTQARLAPIQRLVTLCRRGCFARSLFSNDPKMERWLTMLRVHDGLLEGATQRQIGESLYPEDRVMVGWNERNDFIRSRIRRLIRDARQMASGGYRRLLSGRR